MADPTRVVDCLEAWVPVFRRQDICFACREVILPFDRQKRSNVRTNSHLGFHFHLGEIRVGIQISVENVSNYISRLHSHERIDVFCSREVEVLTLHAPEYRDAYGCLLH